MFNVAFDRTLDYDLFSSLSTSYWRCMASISSFTSLVAMPGLSLGLDALSQSITVGSITDTASANIQGVLTLIATAALATVHYNPCEGCCTLLCVYHACPAACLSCHAPWRQVSFSDDGSTFHALAAQANAGISVAKDITASAGALLLDADTTTTGGPFNLEFADSVTVTSKTLLMLESITGSIEAAGSLTLSAGDGVLLYDLTMLASPKSMVVNADNDGVGTTTTTFTVTVAASVYNIDGQAQKALNLVAGDMHPKPDAGPCLDRHRPYR